jgi:DNA (cytosine-5)-methyltransferase 1
MKIGSLCSGYGGLDMAVEAYFDAETIWMADTDKSAAKAIDENWKLPNLGDIKNIDWSKVEPIEILTAGYPCQPFSDAGKRQGAKDERHLWPFIKEIISFLRPSIVILENVRGHLSLGFKDVLKDLAEIRYDAKWGIIRASDVGAPHQRARLFVIAYSDSYARPQPRRTDRDISGQASEIKYRSNRKEHRGRFEIISDTDNQRRIRNRERSQSGYDSSGEKIIKSFSDTDDKQLSPNRQVSELGWRFDTRFKMSMRPIPDPLVDGKLNTKYVEYMMGLPEGWVTNLPVSRAQQFKLLGNGVVPQQAYYALEMLGA